MSSSPETDKGGNEPYILLAEGEVNSADRWMLSILLNRFGMSSEFMPRPEYESRQKEQHTAITVDPNVTVESVPYSVFDITDPDQFLVREHLDNYKTLRGNDFKARIGSVYAFLVVGEKAHKNFRHAGTRDDPMLPPPGIVTKPREDAGFEPYTGIINIYSPAAQAAAEYAVQAGGIVEYGKSIENKPGPKVYEIGLIAIANQLESQFE